MIYISILLTLFLIRYVCSQNVKIQDTAYYLILFSLFLFSAFRYEVGCDWIGYYLQFSSNFGRAPSTSVFEREGLWWFLVDHLRVSELPYPAVNVISSAIFFTGAHMLARRQPDRLAFLIFLFPVLIINMPMSGIRQGAAIGIFCIALCAFIDRKPARYALWLLIASGFHSSAILFLLLLPLVKGAYSKRNIIFAGTLLIPGVFLMASGDSFQIAVQRYIQTEVDAAGAIFRTALLALSGGYFFIFLQQKWADKNYQDYKIVSLTATGMVLVLFILPISTVIADRIGYYFIPVQAIIFSRIPSLFTGKIMKSHAILPYLILFIFFSTWTILSWHFSQCYLPYQSWLFGFPEFNPY